MGNEPICGICQGTRAEHFDGDGKAITQHVFSEEGRLVSQADAAKAQQMMRQQPFVMPPKFAGTDAQAVQRLLELMLERGLLSQPDLLYIFGVGPKPPTPVAFLDPAQLFGSGTC